MEEQDCLQTLPFSTIVFIVVPLLLLITLMYKLKCQPFRKYLPNIPIVKEQNWIWGLAFDVMPIDGSLDSHARLHDLVDKYGSTFQFYVLWHHVVYISEGKVVKFVYDNAKQKGSIQRANKKPRIRNLLTMNTDDEWKKRRQSYRHAFTQATLKNYGDIMSAQVVKLMNKLETFADKPNEPVKIDAIFSRFALDAIFKVGFEMDYDFLENEIIFDKINNAIQQFFRLLYLANIPFFHYVRQIPYIGNVITPVGEFNRSFTILRQFRRDVLQHLRQKHVEKSFCSESFGKLLMDYVHDADNAMPEDEVESELMTFILAGHETTSHTLGFLVYSLCKYAHVQEKCNEAAQSMPTESTSVFNPLPDYLEATIKESMRKYPVAARGSTRTALNGCELSLPINNGKDIVHVSSDTCLLVNIFSMHRLEQNWGTDVNVFRPERWLQEGPLASPAAYAGIGRTSDETIYSPFSSGIRNCIGMNFALWEIRSVVLNITRRFTFALADEQLLDEEVALQTDMLTMKIMNQLPVYIRTLPAKIESNFDES